MPDEKRRSPLDAFRAEEAAEDDEELDEIELEELGDELDEMVDEVDPEFYKNGGVTLSESERDALGELHGRRVLVLGAGNGEDVCSLINLGASVTVIDDADSLVGARELAEGAGLSAEFLEGDPQALSVEYRNGDYDIVYSGFGAIDWVDDLDSWAGGIAGSLRGGGLLIAYDEHPMSYIFAASEGHIVVSNSYFGADEEAAAESDAGGDEEEAEADGVDLDEVQNGPTWTIGDIVTALGSNGLMTLSLTEFPQSDRFMTELDQLLDEIDMDELAKVPSTFLLVAAKP